MGYKTNSYKRQRGKYQQPPTDSPCLSCGAKPAENSHLVDWLRLRVAGFPPQVISEDWNLVPLCRPCHWLYDNRYKIWVGHHLKMEGIKGREAELLSEFINHLASVGIVARLISDDSDPAILGDLPQSIEDINVWYGGSEGTTLVTKVGAVFTDSCIGLESEAELVWANCLKKLSVKTTKEYREVRDHWQKEYTVQRDKLQALLQPKTDEAIKRADELAQQHLRHIDLQVGKPWNNEMEISGFDVTKVGEQLVRVYLWLSPTPNTLALQSERK